MIFFMFKQKTAYEMRISDWSSDVCSSDRADAVHSGDRRLLEPCDRARDAMQAPDLGHRPGDTGVAHLLYVHACAKGVSGAGQDDGAHVVVFREIFERRPELLTQDRKSVV